MSWTLPLLLLTLIVGGSPVQAQQATSVDELEEWQLLPRWQEDYSLNAAANAQQLRIDGLRPEMTIGFGGRYDRVVEGAELIWLS